MFSMITIFLCFLNLSIYWGLYFLGSPRHRTMKLWLTPKTQFHHHPAGGRSITSLQGAPPESETRGKNHHLSLKGACRWRAEVVWGWRQLGTWIYFNVSQITQEIETCQAPLSDKWWFVTLIFLLSFTDVLESTVGYCGSLQAQSWKDYFIWLSRESEAMRETSVHHRNKYMTMGVPTQWRALYLWVSVCVWSPDVRKGCIPFICNWFTVSCYLYHIFLILRPPFPRGHTVLILASPGDSTWLIFVICSFLAFVVNNGRINHMPSWFTRKSTSVFSKHWSLCWSPRVQIERFHI